MARRAKYNTQGQIIMGAAAQKARLFSVAEVAERTGIPYRTLHKRLSNDFGKTTADEMKALVKVTRMTGEELMEVFG